jgi:hypothetical protein
LIQQPTSVTGTTSSSSNSDPIAINNSISSSHSASHTDSPTYGYNVTAATSATLNNHANHLDTNQQQDSILYIKSTTLNNNNLSMISNSHPYATNNNSSMTYPPLDESNYLKNTLKSKNIYSTSNTSSNQLMSRQTNAVKSSAVSYMVDQSESGYSTPSRHKKVVYEVIV